MRQRSTLILSGGIRYINAMFPRIRVEPPVENRSMERDMRELIARLDVTEIAQRREPNVGDVSDAENEEVVVEYFVKEHLLEAIVKLGARERIDIPMYEGNLDIEKFLDWIREMDKYFDYEYVDEEKRVKHVVTRLKGHASLWWDEIQDEKTSKGKKKMKSWDRMVTKLKDKFIPKEYHINMFKRLQNLRNKGIIVKKYTEEFYNMNIKVGQRERDEEKVARYINDLRYEIQDEINMMTIRKVEDA
jgi:hypothetical protein